MGIALGLQHSSLNIREEPAGDQSIGYEQNQSRLLRQTSIELKVCKGLFVESDYVAGSDWKAVKRILNFLGYEPKYIRAILVPEVATSERSRIIRLYPSQLHEYEKKFFSLKGHSSPCWLWQEIRNLC